MADLDSDHGSQKPGHMAHYPLTRESFPPTKSLLQRQAERGLNRAKPISMKGNFLLPFSQGCIIRDDVTWEQGEGSSLDNNWRVRKLRESRRIRGDRNDDLMSLASERELFAQDRLTVALGCSPWKGDFFILSRW